MASWLCPDPMVSELGVVQDTGFRHVAARTIRGGLRTNGGALASRRVAGPAGSVESLRGRRDIVVGVVADGALQAAVRFIEAAAEYQALARKTGRERALLNLANLVEVDLARRASMTGAAYLRHAKSGELAGMEDRGPAALGRGCADMLQSGTMAAFAANSHFVPGRHRIIRQWAGRVTAETFLTIFVRQDLTEGFGKRPRDAFARARGQVKSAGATKPGNAAFDIVASIVHGYRRDGLGARAESPAKVHRGLFAAAYRRQENRAGGIEAQAEARVTQAIRQFERKALLEFRYFRKRPQRTCVAACLLLVVYPGVAVPAGFSPGVPGLLLPEPLRRPRLPGGGCHRRLKQHTGGDAPPRACRSHTHDYGSLRDGLSTIRRVTSPASPAPRTAAPVGFRHSSAR